MEETILPFQISKGMVVIGSFIGEEEDDLYVWIRRFETEEQREQLYAAVYEDDRWVNEFHHELVNSLIDPRLRLHGWNPLHGHHINRITEIPHEHRRKISVRSMGICQY